MGFNSRDDDFDVSSYVKVNTRLSDFWTKHPNGRIETEYAIHEGVLVMEARLYRDQKDEKPAATGHSFLESLAGEKVGEYSETVAVGRALALMGFQVEKSIASAEEMTRWNNNKKTKAEPKAAAEPAKESTPAVAAPAETPAPKLRTTSRFSASKFTNGVKT